jgi:hypothetical protein
VGKRVFIAIYRLHLMQEWRPIKHINRQMLIYKRKSHFLKN